MAEQDKGVEELLDRMLEGRKPEDLVGAGGHLADLTKRLYERALEGELTAHLGYGKHAPEAATAATRATEKSTKRLKTETGDLALEIPRDREGSFDPVLVPNGQRQPPGVDERVIAPYARGVTTCEIPGHRKETYKAGAHRR
jgi:transposase-like protein